MRKGDQLENIIQMRIVITIATCRLSAIKRIHLMWNMQASYKENLWKL